MGYAVHIPSLCQNTYLQPVSNQLFRLFVRLTCEYKSGICFSPTEGYFQRSMNTTRNVKCFVTTVSRKARR